MNIPACLIVGNSGTGKSTSIKNLDKDKTCILNIEKKVLPFKSALEFKHNKMLETALNFDDALDAALKSPAFDTIVIESFHRYSDRVLELSKQLAKGYDIYNVYADRICKMVNKLLNAENKYIFVIANPENQKIENPNGTTSNRYRVAFHGNLIDTMGGVESFFTIALFTEAKVDPQGKATYRLLPNTDGINAAKSPAEMFDGPVPNDLKLVKEKINAYYGIK